MFLVDCKCCCCSLFVTCCVLRLFEIAVVRCLFVCYLSLVLFVVVLVCLSCVAAVRYLLLFVGWCSLYAVRCLAFLVCR